MGVPMPAGQPGLNYSLAYFVRDASGALHVIDPGWDTPDNRRRMSSALENLGGTVATVIATHHHRDHLGAAPWIREQTGALVVVHRLEIDAMRFPEDVAVRRLEEWGVPEDRRAEILAVRGARPTPIHIDRIIEGDEARLEIPGWNACAILTPGHTPGHISVRLDDARLLLSGDFVLPNVFAGLGLGNWPTPANPIAVYQKALAATEKLVDYEVLPGHGFRFRGLAARAAATSAHHRRRTAEVCGELARDATQATWDVASRLTWSRGFEALAGGFLLSALAQTAHHRELCRSGR